MTNYICIEKDWAFSTLDNSLGVARVCIKVKVDFASNVCIHCTHCMLYFCVVEKEQQKQILSCIYSRSLPLPLPLLSAFFRFSFFPSSPSSSSSFSSLYFFVHIVTAVSLSALRQGNARKIHSRLRMKNTQEWLASLLQCILHPLGRRDNSSRC